MVRYWPLLFHFVIIGRYCWIIIKERLGWLEPWQVSLGGEHYVFPEPHYFMNISITNLILLWPILICFTLHTLLFGQSESEGNLRVRGICQWAEGKTFSGQVKVPTLITSLKLGSNADLDFHKITLPLLTPELNILSSMSAMHVDLSPQVSSVVFDEAESAAWRGGFHRGPVNVPSWRDPAFYHNPSCAIKGNNCGFISQFNEKCV